MKLIVNDKELAYYLISLIDVKDYVKHLTIDESNSSNVAGVIAYILSKKELPKFQLGKFKIKFKEKIRNGVSNDLANWRREVQLIIKQVRADRLKKIQKHAGYIIDRLDENLIIESYLKSPHQHFIKTVGQQLDATASMMRRKRFDDATQDCLLRNTVGNGTILIDKIDNNYPFWFIDSGYSNFLEPNKKWHRLVRNHLHFNNYFDAPTDRLSLFPNFPLPWKKNGKKILIVEPGPFAASILHVDYKTWGVQIADELRKFTDRPIEFRSKTEKKTRSSLYRQLLNGDYYCTVSINSNSAVESIWAGIPAITLDKHVSNMVTVNSLDKINDLYYGPLGNWLSWLSYCQFTYDELMNGTALQIVREYHGVKD